MGVMNPVWGVVATLLHLSAAARGLGPGHNPDIPQAFLIFEEDELEDKFAEDLQNMFFPRLQVRGLELNTDDSEEMALIKSLGVSPPALVVVDKEGLQHQFPKHKRVHRSMMRSLVQWLDKFAVPYLDTAPISVKQWQTNEIKTRQDFDEKCVKYRGQPLCAVLFFPKNAPEWKDKEDHWKILADAFLPIKFVFERPNVMWMDAESSLGGALELHLPTDQWPQLIIHHAPTWKYSVYEGYLLDKSVFGQNLIATWFRSHDLPMRMKQQRYGGSSVKLDQSTQAPKPRKRQKKKRKRRRSRKTLERERRAAAKRKEAKRRRRQQQQRMEL